MSIVRPIPTAFAVIALRSTKQVAKMFEILDAPEFASAAPVELHTDIRAAHFPDPFAHATHARNRRGCVAPGRTSNV